MTNQQISPKNNKTQSQPLLLFGLYQQSKKNDINSKPHKFAELHQFHQEADIIHQPYQTHKKNAFAYKSIFWGIAFLFLSLMFVIQSQSASWICGLYFQNCDFARLSLSGTCAFLALSSITIASLIRAEREAVAFVLNKAKKKLKIIYAQQCAFLGFQRILMWFGASLDGACLRRKYHEALDKLHDIKEHSLQLMRHIKNSQHLDKETREKLLNQAIHSLNEELDHVVKAVEK